MGNENSTPAATATASTVVNATASTSSSKSATLPAVLPKFFTRNELVIQLVGETAWASHDKQWSVLLSGSITNSATVPIHSVNELGASFVKNNTKTQNFNSLLLVTAELLRKIRTNKTQTLPFLAEFTTSLLHACHALWLVRTFSAYFVQNLDSFELSALFRGYRSTTTSPVSNGTKTDAASGWFSEYFLDELLLTLIELPHSGAFGYVYLEVVSTIMVLCGTQLAQSTTERTSANTFLETIFSQYGAQAVPISGRLIRNVEGSIEPKNQAGDGSLSVAYTLPDKLHTLISEVSMLLVCILANQEWRRSPNLFRLVFAKLRDTPSAETVSSAPLAVSALPSSTQDILALSFEKLYLALVQHIDKRETALFLYVCVVENASFNAFVCTRQNPDQLLLPLLQLLYNELIIADRDTSYIYVLLIFLLILTQNAEFNKRLQTITIASVSWYKDRELRQISLSSLCVLVLIRAIQLNVAELKDVYLQTTCLASLANLAPHLKNMHQVTAQRFITFFDLIAKKYHKMTKSRGTDAAPSVSVTSSASSSVTSSSTSSSQQLAPSLIPTTSPEELNMIIMNDLLQLLLEIINVILVKQIEHNPRLVYVILYQHDQLTSFRTHATMGHLIGNIDSIIAYFNARIAQANLDSPSPETIVAVVTKACNEFRTAGFDRLTEVANLSFGYEEEASADEFFSPFAWTAVIRNPLFSFDLKLIKLLKKDKTSATAL